MSKTTYVTIRIDYEDDGRFGSYEAEGIAADMVVERAGYHNHTIENGISIENIKNCGVNQ